VKGAEQNKIMTELKIRIIGGFLFCTLLTSCTKKYKFTSAVCDKKLFVEVFNVNPFGVDADYLTDSLNFRKYIGDCDSEHEIHSYTCKGDSLYIIKMENGSKNCQEIVLPSGHITIRCDVDTIRSEIFSMSTLKREHKFE
jgi:hypothetical protein